MYFKFDLFDSKANTDQVIVAWTGNTSARENVNTATLQGPGLQSFLTVKVTITLREIILRHNNQHLIIGFRSGFVFNR